MCAELFASTGNLDINAPLALRFEGCWLGVFFVIMRSVKTVCEKQFICVRESPMSEAKVRGIVHLIEETKTYGQKGFRKRLVVLEQDNGRFPNFVPLEFVQDNCDSADDLAVGNDVEVSYKLAGRNGKKIPTAK